MPDGLYDRDALAWAEQQADLLRRLAAGERVNDAADWANVIEEVQDVVLSELRSCRSLLRQAMTHLLKLHAWPGSAAAVRWHEEAGTFLDDAEQRFTPSMRQRIDLDDLYARALRWGADGDRRCWTTWPVARRMPIHAARIIIGRYRRACLQVSQSCRAIGWM